MDKKTIEVKRDFCKAQMEYWATRYEKRVADLAEAEKPKLRHGGTGKDRTGNFVLIGEDALWKKVYERGTGITSTAINKNDDARVLAEWANQLTANIFDDLKAIAEDLPKFKMKETDSANEFAVSTNASTVELKDKKDSEKVNIDLKDFSDFILNLRRMEATMKRAEQE